MEEQEQVEWDDVNKLLQYHGFKPVRFSDPVENRNISDLVLLDKKSSVDVRTTLRTMLTDSERRQALIQELVKSNNKLKAESQGHMTQAAVQTHRTSQLEELLDQVKLRLQELEERYLNTTRKRDQQRDQQVMDFYQNKTSELQEELRKMQKRASAPQVEELQREVVRLKEELEKRPTLKDVTQRRLEGGAKHSRRLERSSKDVIFGDQSPEARLCVLYQQLLMEIKAVVTNPTAPQPPHRHGSPSPHPELAAFQEVLPTLETWAQQRHLLKPLHGRLEQLFVEAMSGGPRMEAGGPTVEDMMFLVDTILENSFSEDQRQRSPTRHTLRSMVSHFQLLFDAPTLSGVYPRMAELYARLGEMTNAMRSLRELLELDSRASPAQVVDHVTRQVCSDGQMEGLPPLLQDADIQSLSVKVRDQEEFFRVFHSLVTDILHTLGVTRLDDIIPTLRSLKRSAQS